MYIPTQDGIPERGGPHLIPLRSMKEQRCRIYLDPRNMRFAPVNTNTLGTPQEERVYRPIRRGQMEDKILRIVSEAASRGE